MSTIYDVHFIQARLNHLGYRDPDGQPLKEDGVFGPTTSFAVRAFKRSVGFKDTDYVGPLTWAALSESAAQPDTTIPWLAEAQRVLGLHESRDLGTLTKLFNRTMTKVNPATTAWCGGFQHFIHKAWNPEVEVPKNYLSARAWAAFGEPCPLQLGATVVLWRGSPSGWQGHVFTCLGHDPKRRRIYGIGGNQKDSVTRDWFSMDRVLAVRWPLGFPQTGKQLLLDGTGQPLSQNEA